MVLITIPDHISMGTFAGHGLMLALPGKRHLQGSIDLQDSPVAQSCSW